MLLFAQLAGNRALGFACAVGIAIAMAFALLVLPAALVVCGRGVFWPFVPSPDARRGGPGFWARLGRGVARRPALVAAAFLAGVAVLALGLSGYRVGLSQVEQLLGRPDSVTAQEVIERSFPEAAAPSVVLVAAADSAGNAADL